MSGFVLSSLARHYSNAASACVAAGFVGGFGYTMTTGRSAMQDATDRLAGRASEDEGGLVVTFHLAPAAAGGR